MKKAIIFLLINIASTVFSLDITKNYVQVYGEGPKGRIPIEFNWQEYSEKDTVILARTEAVEFLCGMIYGYNFVYKVENPLAKEQGFFELTHICRIDNADPSIRLSQLEESTQFMRLQAEYRLNEDQKLYINGFRTHAGQMTMGTGTADWNNEWETRLTGAYKNAIRNAVLNAVRRQLQSRPQFITGKILLRQSPRLMLVTNKWQCDVKLDLIIEEVTYRESY